MKTFKQFFDESVGILERYYRPDEKLPSGKTPVQRAVEQNIKRNTEQNSRSNPERTMRQGMLITQKVKHGADNKNYNPTPNHPDVDVDAYKDQYMTVYHHPSGIRFNATKGPEGFHTVDWGHGRDKEDMSQRERVRLAKTAGRVWHQHVLPNMPQNSIIHNRPTPDTITPTGEKRNKRADIYQTRGGLGPVDKYGDQFGYIGRPPSPRQQAKGKKQVQPRNPEDVKKSVDWHEID